MILCNNQGQYAEVADMPHLRISFIGLIFSLFIQIQTVSAFEETVRIEQIGSPLNHPWGMSFINPTTMVVTERRGRLYQMDVASGERQEIQNLPDVLHKRQGGLLDVHVHDGWVYLCFSTPTSDGAATSLMRGRIRQGMLVDKSSLFTSNLASQNGVHFGCRILIHEGYLYLSIGDRGERHTAQDPARHTGAVIRLYPDGTIPERNTQKANWDPALFTKGHRNPQGMAINPKTGKIWVHEHGPKGGDEINILASGANYGWPVISYGREYYGARIGEGLTTAPGMTDPIWVWVPSIAPSGMAFYEGVMFPELDGDLLVGSLKFRSLYHVRLRDNRPVAETPLLRRKLGRIRDVAVMADGSILVLTDEKAGGLYRLFR